MRQPGGRSEHSNECIVNLVLNQGMKGYKYVIAYDEQYEEDSAGPPDLLYRHVGGRSWLFNVPDVAAEEAAPAALLRSIRETPHGFSPRRRW